MGTRIVLLLAALLITGCGAASREERPRQTAPLMLKVVDTQSGAPLAGVTIYYLVDVGTYWTTFPMTIEALIKRRIAATAMGKTDAHGVARFEGRDISLTTYWLQPKRQQIDREMLFINLAPSPAAPDYLKEASAHQFLYRRVPFLEHLIRPNEAYLGYFLGTANIETGHETEQEGVATYRWEPLEFGEDVERHFTIRLKPASGSTLVEPSRTPTE